MEVVDRREIPGLSAVYLADFGGGKLAEFADSVQPPHKITEKWVVLVSTLFGCPIGCKMCDAGNSGPYGGPIDTENMLSQIDYAITQRFPNGLPPIKKFKIQFARMGEPSFNKDVIEVLRFLPQRYPGVGLLPSVSTVAPAGREIFFEDLKKIKDELYPNGKFQLQFSIHTTDERERDWLIPVKKWGLAEIADYGDRFYSPGDRKITLNFALVEGKPLEVEALKQHFDPARYLVKITPVNPTYEAEKNELQSATKRDKELQGKLEALRQAGYEVILSIGELEENEVGSNCGQLVQRYLKEGKDALPRDSYGHWR